MDFKITADEKPKNETGQLLIYISQLDMFDVAVYYESIKMFKTNHGQEYTIYDVNLWTKIDYSHPLIQKGGYYDKRTSKDTARTGEDQDRAEGKTDPDKEQ